MRSLEFPPPEVGLAFHRRLLDSHDLAVWNEVCGAYMDPLCDWLARRFRSFREENCSTAAGDALFAFISNPTKFDPTKIPDLGKFLCMAARRDLLNIVRNEARHQRKRDASIRVEELGLAGNSLREEPLSVLARREEQAAASRFFEDVGTGSSDPERAVLSLMIDGVRSSVRYAGPLGLEYLPEQEMRREVKKVKDRLEKRIKRKGEANDDPARQDG